MLFCKNCEFYVEKMSMCDRDEYVQYDLITGVRLGRPNAYVARKSEHLCGYDARGFRTKRRTQEVPLDGS